MNKLFAKRMDELAPSGIRKVNEKALAMERAGETVIHFELGRPDFDTPEYIKKACIADIEKGDVFYTSNFGTMELREAIAWKLKTPLIFPMSLLPGNGPIPSLMVLREKRFWIPLKTVESMP